MNRDTLAVDFAALAIGDPDFAKIYTACDGHINFQDPDTVQQVTKSILKREFGLFIELPNNRLCPPIPVRYSYIKWLQKLLDTTSDDYSEKYDEQRDVIGIDIGVGASCIYPLLGCNSRPNWRFGGTELDGTSFEFAMKNVNLNKLQSRVRLRKVEPSSSIMPLGQLGIQQADFVMCNPPFFTSVQEMMATHLTKKRSPSAICSGAEVEMITPGGDLGFVIRMIEESESLHDRVQWFSSLLGKLSSVSGVVDLLRKKNITNWAVTSFQAGNVTKRWAVAWSFQDLRPRNDVARASGLAKDILPFPAQFKIQCSLPDSQTLVGRIDTILKFPAAQWTWEASSNMGIFLSPGNVWSRAARRSRQRKSLPPEALQEQSGRPDRMTFGVKIAVFPQPLEITIRWLKGADSLEFESFYGMIRRSISMNSSG